MDIERLINVIKECGDLTLQYQEGIEAEIKEDGSKVTKADKDVNEILEKFLGKEYPTFGIMSEEMTKEYKEYTWYVDPIDGTNAYIRGENYFNILLGLVRDGIPVFGIIYNPPSRKIYIGGENEKPRMIDSESIEYPLTMAPTKKETLLFSHSYNPDILKNYEYRLVDRKILGDYTDTRVRIVNGDINLQIENPEGKWKWGTWDICAGHAILNSFGGKITGYHGEDINYSEPLLNEGYIAADSIDRIRTLPWISR